MPEKEKISETPLPKPNNENLFSDTPEVYQENRCWWTFKGRKFNTPQHTCGAPATQYKVTRIARHAFVNREDGLQCAYAYLCDHHKKMLENKGYAAIAKR